MKLNSDVIGLLVEDIIVTDYNDIDDTYHVTVTKKGTEHLIEIIVSNHSKNVRVLYDGTNRVEATHQNKNVIPFPGTKK